MVVRRDRNKRIIWASPGLVFPIMSAMRRFAVDDGTWKIVKPSVFKPAEMISQAVGQFRSVGSDPSQMGRSIGAYEALLIYPTTLMTVVADLEAEQRASATSGA